MKLDGLDHPKTLDFAARLDVSLPQAIGHLELLWAFVAQKTPRGNVGKWADGAIARAAHWTTDASVFVTALHESGFLDADDKHRFIVHDWHEHAPRWVRAKLKKCDLEFCLSGHYETEADSSADCSGDYSGDCSAGSSAYSKPSLAKLSQGKVSQENIGADALATEKRIMAHLREHTGARFQDTKKNLGHITARLAEKNSEADLMAVVDFKCQEWGQDAKMRQYLRPETLFGPSKFPGYLAAARASPTARHKGFAEKTYTSHTPDWAKESDDE